ncbi:hypothetical protein GGI17_004911 [Coemansia sp. S146]|nr:hypothetical protein GGI17_004911 [Coemansia sp. S146]
MEVRDFAGIIVDDGGDYVQYPQLLVLKLDTFSTPEDKLLPTFPDAVPFPKLCRIALGGQYPLDDDTIFRGNATTPEYLSLTIQPQQLVLFRERRVFTPTSHPNLRYVRIVHPDDVTPDNIYILVVNKGFVLGIGPNALMREVANIPFCVDLPCMLSLDMDRSCLQFLLLYGTSLDFAELILLLIKLPFLTDLHCRFGKRFWCWHFDISWVCPQKECAVAGIGLSKFQPPRP